MPDFSSSTVADPRVDELVRRVDLLEEQVRAERRVAEGTKQVLDLVLEELRLCRAEKLRAAEDAIARESERTALVAKTFEKKGA